MDVVIGKTCNPQGVPIPKPMLGQAAPEDEIRPSYRKPRAGWADDARRLAEEGVDALVWPAISNVDDANLAW